MDLSKPLQAKAEREKQVALLAEYFRCKRRKEHTVYAAKMILCEILNVVNVFGQLYLMDFFLGGHFATYGTDVFTLSEQGGNSIDFKNINNFLSKCYNKKNKSVVSRNP